MQILFNKLKLQLSSGYMSLFLVPDSLHFGEGAQGFNPKATIQHSFDSLDNQKCKSVVLLLNQERNKVKCVEE